MPTKPFVYRDRRTKEISFPLGGIGTGCIGLGGNGRLVDWEIFNKPNKGSYNGFSHFAIKAERNGTVLDARVLNGDLPPPYGGQLGHANFQSFGFGAPRQTLAGLPHFRNAEFTGTFPMAEVAFVDPSFPGRVKLTAFNPFIPLNDRDSGIPAAFFEFEIANSSRHAIRYTLAGTLANPLPANNLHRVRHRGGLWSLQLGCDRLRPAEMAYGDLTLATDAPDVSVQAYWYRGSWFDNLEVYWRDFTSVGRLRDRIYPARSAGRDNHGTLAARRMLRPGQKGKVRFVIAWNFPNCENYWNPDACRCARRRRIPATWKNYYATQWKDSRDSAAHSLANWPRLFGETARFKDALFASDLPSFVLDAISANISILKTPTVLRLEDGTFYGWEGCHPTMGCCDGSCTHVWNYAMALPFLFPKLERNVRVTDFRRNRGTDGSMSFRLQLPLGVPRSTFRPCADGQFGGIMKAYRDWKICGDTQWLRRLWPFIKASIEFAWHPDNSDRWDPDRTGVLWGRQHHTLDMELFGPNSWLTGFYLGALKAGAEMAEAVGDPKAAAEYRRIFIRGKAWTDRHLFNGEYYQQAVDLNDRGILRRFDQRKEALHQKASNLYWSAEHGEMKYQIGAGCEIDQLLAQWHANLYGVGEIFDPGQARRALAALFKHNFKTSMRGFYNPWRLFCLNDEAGLVICEWPKGKRKPSIPLTYAQETMPGFEYAAAALMIQSGLVKEGLRVVKAVRDRYDGAKRNPWNEFECGSNYARSMASYSMLNALSGFQYDLARGFIGFKPVQTRSGKFRCFWSLDSGWGEFAMEGRWAEVRVLAGHLRVNALKLPFEPRSVRLGRRRIAFRMRDGVIHIDPVNVVARGALRMGR